MTCIRVMRPESQDSIRFCILTPQKGNILLMGVIGARMKLQIKQSNELSARAALMTRISIRIRTQDQVPASTDVITQNRDAICSGVCQKETVDAVGPWPLVKLQNKISALRICS